MGPLLRQPRGQDVHLPGQTAPQPLNAADLRKGLLLEYASLAYNVLEAVVALTAGVMAGSISLIGFGIDSVVESSSAAVMLWRLRSSHPEAERRAQKLIAVSLYALAAYVFYESSESLLSGEGPAKSWVGIALAVSSLLVMPWLARAKRRVGHSLASAAMVSDSKQTELCAWLSAILLAGLGLHALFGWWWADAAAGLAMVPIIAREGYLAWQGHACGHCH